MRNEGLKTGGMELEGLTARNNLSKPQCFPQFRVLHTGILVHYLVLEGPSFGVIVAYIGLDGVVLIDMSGDSPP